MKKRFLSILLCVCIILGMLPGFITTAYASTIPNGTYDVPGTYGSIQFTVSGNTLTVSGTGAIPDRTLDTSGNILGTEYVTATYGAAITKIVVESGITRLGNFAFAAFDNVTEITIPESVTEIGMYALWSSGITSLQLPSKLSFIDTLAIVNCPSLSSITFANDSTDTALTTVRFRFVSDCPSLKLIRFSPSVASILPAALSDVADNTGLCIEAYMKYRGAAIYNTDGLKGLPDGVVKNYCELTVQNNFAAVNVNPTKNASAFYTSYYAAGDTVSFTVTPDPGYALTPVSSFRQGALSPISGSTYALIMASDGDCLMVTAIDPSASGTVVASGTMPNNSNITWQVIQVDSGYKLFFSGSGELSVSDEPSWKATYKDSIYSVEIGEGITKITTASIVGGGAFYGYSNLKEISFPSSLTEIGGSAFNSTSELESVTLSSGVKTVGPSAFKNCYKIKSIILNDGLTYIGEQAFPYAFTDGSVSSATVTIPSTVTSIGANAFPNSGKLTLYNCSSASFDLAQPIIYFCVPVATNVTGGSVTMSAPTSGYKNYYYYGNDLGSGAETVTITAPSGKVITSIKRGGMELLEEGAEASSYTYTVVNGSNALDITLEAIPRNITYAAASGGTITGAAAARAGDTVTVTAIPESGLSCTGIYLKIGSSPVGIEVSGNSFKMPDDDVTISAIFAATLKLTGALSASGTYGQALSTLLPALTEGSRVETDSGTEVAGTWSFDEIQSLDGHSIEASGILPAVGGTTGYAVTFTPSANPEYYANTLTEVVVPVMSYLNTDAVAVLEGIKAEDSEWYTSDVTLSAPDGFNIASAIDDAYGAFLTVSSDMDGSYIYYLKQTVTDYITDAKIVILRRDATMPAISVAEASDVTQEAATVTVTAQDAPSGVASYTLNCTTGGLPDQNNKTGVFNLAGLQPNTDYTFTATVIDNAGNVSEGSSVSFKSEKTAPAVDTEPSFASAVYGAKLSELTINQGSTDVTGTWELDEADADSVYPTVGGTTTYTIRFVPADAAYSILTRELTPVIEPKALSVTGAAAADRKYDETKQLGITDVTLDGVVASDTGNVNVDTSSLIGTISSADAGIYDSVTLPAMTLIGTAAGNYTLIQPTVPVPTTVSVARADALNLSGNATMVKNQANYTKELDLTQISGYPAAPAGTPVLTVSDTGPYNGLTSATIEGGKLTLVADNTANSMQDIVTISVTGMGNYADSTITVTVNYTDKTLILISGLSAPTGRIYNGSEVTKADFGIPVLTPDTYNSENLTYTYYDGSSASEASIPTPKGAGTYTVRIAVPETDEDFAGYCDITFTIDKATVTATADDKSMIAGGTLPAFTVSYTGIVDSDTAESIFTAPAIASCEADGNTAGSYPISAAIPVLTEEAATNYTVAAPVSGTLTVNNDTTAPEVSFGTDGNETWSALAASTVTVTDTESGVDAASLKYAWSTDTAAPSSGWASFTSGDTLTKGGSDGDWYLHIQAADAFGNVTNAVSGRFRLDNTASTVILLSPQGTNVPVSVSDIVLGFSEGVSGVENKKVTVSDGTDMYIYTIGESDNNISVTDSVYRAAIPVEWFVKDMEPLILEYNTEYTVGLEAGAYIDAAGNGLDSGDISSFKTEKESYTVTFKDWDETVLNTQTVIDGSKATSPANPARAGYSFAGWYVDKAYTALFDFNTAITDDQTLYAKWTKVDPDSGDSDDENSDRKDSGGRASTAVPVPSVTPRTSETAEASLPKAAIEAARSSMNVLSLTTPIASISFDAQTLDSIEEQTASELTFSAGRVDPETLGEDARKLVGDRPVYDFSITSGGRTISQFGGKATVSIPYKPMEEELRNPEYITVWYIDGSGNVVPVPSGRYDASTGTVSFTATHFSKYAVVYVQKSFGDLESTVWAKKQIEVLASKGIMEGRTDNVFAPQVGITRAEYIAALVKTLGVTAKADTNFKDVAERSRYYEEIAIAKKLGISNGSENNCFKPEDTITRQDMLVLTERALRSLGKLSSIGASADLERFTDRAEVKDYAAASIAALVKEGLIEGSSGKLNVKSDTTRAEAAVFLYRLYNR